MIEARFIPEETRREIVQALTNRELHERILKTSGRLLADGAHEIRITKLGRNDPCPCGSGRKFKRCCIAIGR